MEKFKEIVDADNVKSAVIHKDELVRHIHIFWQPVTEDGRLCAKEMHNKEFLRRLNKEMPEHLHSKGWYMVDDCKAYEEGSQEKKKAKRKSGKTSKVYKHEMDSLAEELALQREEIQKKEEVKELKSQNENLQTQLDFISSQMQNIVEQEYQKRRKDAEVIASYQQYCGVSPDKIEEAVREQEKDHYSLQDYDSH
ncbi:MAG: plasmid recombination protein [Oscillospiraceae bacterium]|nr:plasmid recombination protein [Oscillospiraceae bacterium]